jgi:hypothetical protein
MRDWYEIRKKGNSSGPTFVFDECNMISIIKMSKTRNKTLHRRLMKWFQEVNPTIVRKSMDLSLILEGIEEIGKI